MKTTREIQNRWVAVRKRKAPCFTTQIEARIRQKIEAEHGEILDSASRHRIETREQMGSRKCNSAVLKAQRKILKQKEKARLIQEMRENRECNAPEESKTNKPSVDGDASRKRGYREIAFEY